MTKVAIVSAAYWGDVMPYVPIAEELAGHGHEVTLAVPRGFHEAIGQAPFDLAHLGTDFSPRELAHHGHIMDRAESPLACGQPPTCGSASCASNRPTRSSTSWTA